MIYALAACLGLLIAVLRRVPLRSIADIQFRGIAWLVPAAGLRVLLAYVEMSDDVGALLAAPVLPGVSPLALPLGGLVNIASFACAVAFLYANRRLPGFWLILLGLALNLVVIVASGGQMPGDRAQLAAAGLLQDQLDALASGRWTAFSVVDPGAPLWFLADVIYVPLPFGGPTVASIGDFVIALGVIAFFNPPAAAQTPAGEV